MNWYDSCVWACACAWFFCACIEIVCYIECKEYGKSHEKEEKSYGAYKYVFGCLMCCCCCWMSGCMCVIFDNNFSAMCFQRFRCFWCLRYGFFCNEWDMTMVWCWSWCCRCCWYIILAILWYHHIHPILINQLLWYAWFSNGSFTFSTNENRLTANCYTYKHTQYIEDYHVGRTIHIFK